MENNQYLISFLENKIKEYKKLMNSLNKNENKLLKVCQKFIDTKDYNLLLDLEYLASCVFNDSQDLLLIEIVGGKE